MDPTILSAARSRIHQADARSLPPRPVHAVGEPPCPLTRPGGAPGGRGLPGVKGAEPPCNEADTVLGGRRVVIPLAVRRLFCADRERHVDLAQPAARVLHHRSFTWKMDAADVSRLAEHANICITLDMYLAATAGILDRATTQ